METSMKYQKGEKSKDIEEIGQKKHSNEDHRKECIEKWLNEGRKLLDENNEVLIIKKLRSRLYKALIKGETTKSEKTITLLGCTIEELRAIWKNNLQMVCLGIN